MKGDRVLPRLGRLSSSSLRRVVQDGAVKMLGRIAWQISPRRVIVASDGG